MTESDAHTPDELLGKIEDAQTGDVLTFDERVNEVRQSRRDAVAFAEEESRKRNIAVGSRTRQGGTSTDSLSQKLEQTTPSPSFESRETKEIRKLREDVSRVEGKLDAILAALDLEVPDDD